MTNQSEEEFWVQYHAKKSCLEASGRFFTRNITLGISYSVVYPSAESNHEPNKRRARAYAPEHERMWCTTDASVVHHPVFANTADT
jgi:hypothetical protein